MSFMNRRDLGIAVCARAISLLGDEMAAIALLLRWQSHGGGAPQIALLLVAAMLPIVVLAPLAGRAADRYDSRLLLVSASLAQAAACALLVFTTAPLAVLALVAALAAGQAFTATTWQALLPAISGPADLTRAAGMSQAATTVAGIAAPALAGVLTGAFGARIPLLIDTATFLAITVAALLVRTRRGSAQPTDSVQSGGFALVWCDPLLRVLVMLLALFITLGAMVNVVEVFLVRSTFGASATWYGVLGAVWGVGLFAGALVAGRLPQSRLAAGAVLGTIGLSAGLLGYAVAPGIWWVLPAGIIGGIGNGAINVTGFALVALRSAETHRGRVMASVNAVACAAQLGAYALGGVVGGLLSPRAVFGLAGLAGLLAPALLGHRLLTAARSAPGDAGVKTTAEPAAVPA
jgi:MFS family permease